MKDGCTRGWWLVAALTLCSTRTGAQSMAQGLAGVVRDSASRGIAGATVEVRNSETGYVVRTSTTPTGRYAVLGLPIGGPYTVRARRVGFEPTERAGVTLTIGSRVQVDLKLRTGGTRLEAINVSAMQETGRNDGRNSRVGGSTRITRAQLDALPVADRNVSELAALSPLAGPQLSLTGQRWTGTDIRFDGAQARNQLRAGELNGGPTAISLEAVREVEVNTALYDAALGRQGGGQLTAVTRSGTNTTEARLFTGFRNTSLAAPRDYAGRPRSAREAQTLQTAVAGGGPIMRDRSHWFAVYERNEGQDQLITGDVSTPEAENASGISRDSLQRVLGILAARYGVTDTTSQLGRLRRAPHSQTLFARVDWQLTPRNRSTLRLTVSDWFNPLGGGVDQPIALREARSTFTSREAQLYAALTTQLDYNVTHELQVTAGRGHRALTPESPALPRAFVQVRSLLPNGSLGTSTVQFGGNRLAPDDSREWQWQLQQRVTASRGAWVLSAGQDHALTGARTYIAEAQSGLFVFPSIDALAQARPDRFTRTVPSDRSSTESRQRVAELGVFTQAEWQPSPSVSFTAGLRWDATAFLDAPAADSVIDRLFAARTGLAPADWTQWQPRAQLVWRLRGDERDVIRVGGGWFHAQLPYYLQHNQLLYTGRSLTDVDLRGTRTPVPDFQGYRSGTASVPGVPPGTLPDPAYVNVAGAVQAPRTARASAAWVHRFDPRVTVTLGGQWSRARHGYHYIDRNLRQTPSFRLADEDGRGVWVPASSIATSTGATDVRNASRVPEYARVLSLESAGEARQWSLTAEAAFAPLASLTGTVAYAFTRAMDNSSFGCCLARTATTFTPVRDDPRDLTSAWGPADGDQRHRIVATVQSGLPFGLHLDARYSGQSGRPFSLVVDGDINGDESNGNDLAFLFDPSDAATPADVAASMRRLLNDSRSIARRYIAGHLGRVSTRNALRTPFTHRMDARLSRTFRLSSSTLLRRVVVMLDAFNFGHLLNPSWGGQALLATGISSQNPVVNRVPLLRVTGFDPARQRFRYVVNENAGVLTRGGEPWQLQLGVRLER